MARSGRTSTTASSWGSLIVVGIFALAFVVRLIYVLQIQSSPFFDTPVGDAGWHDDWARGLLQQNWSYPEVYFRAPLYPYFLAAIYALLGQSYLVARVVQIILGALSCVLIYRLADKLFDQSVAVVAGVVASLYGVLIYFDAELLIVVLIVFLDLVLLWLLANWEGGRGWFRWTLAGLVMGLSTVARPNIALFVPFLFLWAWHRGPKRERRRALAGCGLLCLMATLVILPVTIHNHRAGDGWVLVSSQSGINFYIGNGHEADGKISAAPGGVAYEDSEKDNVWSASERIAQAVQGRRLKPSQVSQYWFRRALSEIGQAPLRWIGLMARKVYYLLNGHEIESNLSIYSARTWSPLLRVLVWPGIISFPTGLLIPLALVGLWLTRGARRRHLLFYFFLISYGISVVAFFVNSRFRAPLIPILIIYASHAVVWSVRRVRSQRWPSLVAPALIFTIMLLISNSGLFAVDEINIAREHYLQAVAYERKGMPHKAVEQYERCLSIDPYTIMAHFNLAKLYRQGGQLDGAILEYHRVLALQPDFAEGYNGLGIALAQKGDYQEAIDQFHQAIALKPDHGWAQLNLANVYYQMGVVDSALIMYRQAQQLLPQVDYIREQITRLESQSHR